MYWQSREEFFRNLLPGVRDEEGRLFCWAVILEERAKEMRLELLKSSTHGTGRTVALGPAGDVRPT